MKPSASTLIISTLAPLLLSSCAGIGVPFSPTIVKGQVLDANGDKPMSGVVVVATWYGTGGFGQTNCYHVESTATDEQGRYQFAPAEKEFVYRSTARQINVIAYAPGYVYAHGRQPNRVFQSSDGEQRVPISERAGLYRMVPHTGSTKQRLEYLERFSGLQCGARENYSKQLLPLYKSIYEEAARIAVTKEEKQSASDRLRDLEEMEIGSDKSWENWEKRKRELQ